MASQNSGLAASGPDLPRRKAPVHGRGTQAALDDLVALAALVCDVPTACVVVRDGPYAGRSAAIGLPAGMQPSDLPFLDPAVAPDEFVQVTDAAADDRFADAAIVRGTGGLRFHAAIALREADGTRLGTLGVLDRSPRALDGRQQRALAALARQAVDQLALRHAVARRASDEIRHMRILESATDYAIISMDLDGMVTSWNEGAHRIMGWSEADMCGRNCDDFFTPEDRDNRIPDQEMGAALANGHGLDERWHLRKDGSRFWANGEMMPLRDEAGTPVGFLKILRDRTEQHETRKALEATEQRFQLALEAAGFVGAWDYDIAADRLTADAAFARSYSVDPAEAASGLPLDRFAQGIHAEDREAVLERMRQCLEETGEFAEEYRLLAEDGSVRWVFARGRCFYDEAGKATHFPGVALDITARKRMVDSLRESEARTRLALAAADTGAWQALSDLSGLQGDARTRELLGHGADSAIDYRQTFLERLHPDDRADVEATVTQALAPGGSRMLDMEFRTISAVDARTRWIHARGSATDEPGDARGLVGTVRDITAEKAAQAHQTMLANELHHRIKNTLGVVQAIVSQTLRTTDDAAEASRSITERIITMSRAHDLLTQTSWTAAPIRAIITGASAPHLVAPERLTMTGPVMRLGAKPALALAMVMHELCTNAVKYGALSVEGGRVTVDWRADPDQADGAFVMVWQEQGGPAVREPTRKGFGTRLIETSLARELGGTCELDYRPEGFRWTLRARLGAIRDGA